MRSAHTLHREWRFHAGYGLLAVEGNGSKAVDVETFVFGNEIVKEQMVQTTSKKVLRSSEKQKLRAYCTYSM